MIVRRARRALLLAALVPLTTLAALQAGCHKATPPGSSTDFDVYVPMPSDADTDAARWRRRRAIAKPWLATDP